MSHEKEIGEATETVASSSDAALTERNKGDLDTERGAGGTPNPHLHPAVSATCPNGTGDNEDSLRSVSAAAASGYSEAPRRPPFFNYEAGNAELGDGRAVSSAGGQTHELKCWPEFFDAVLDGSKPFEVRRDDRGFGDGDELRLREWDSDYGYSGRECYRRVTHVLHGPAFGIENGFVVMGLSKLPAVSLADLVEPTPATGSGTPEPPSSSGGGALSSSTEGPRDDRTVREFMRTVLALGRGPRIEERSDAAFAALSRIVQDRDEALRLRDSFGRTIGTLVDTSTDLEERALAAEAEVCSLREALRGLIAATDPLPWKPGEKVSEAIADARTAAYAALAASREDAPPQGKEGGDE